jgi:hypothetical protein
MECKFKLYFIEIGEITVFLKPKAINSSIKLIIAFWFSLINYSSGAVFLPNLSFRR